MNSTHLLATPAINVSSTGAHPLQKSRSGFWVMLATLSMLVTGLPAYAVTRDISIKAPAKVSVGTKVTVTVSASTDAAGGEKIGFFHSEYSLDGGVKWIPISYAANVGVKIGYSASFIVKQPAIIRVRVAYRGGKDGDVDYKGNPITWDDTWGEWHEPPAKSVHIDVK